ncbi:MAG TPA: hypothetical protein DCP46_03685 [Lachnospiraceae bacterium]|nr:MBOAT family protein [Lachnospiraceae bacterium]HAL32041.1 hypothetical protein [Lachnospiraceae bacterium]HBB58904.1 hypothetical protein [Lachnospiraceae bacterium]
MAFTSLEFIFIFLPLTVAVYYALYLTGHRGRAADMVLLAASVIFYAAGEPDRVLLLIASIAVNYITGELIASKREKKALAMFLLTGSLVFNFGILFYYKYMMFRNGAANVTLPLGLSFYTFRTVSYCLDVYWDMLPAHMDLFDTALYISFFPQISMGPISRCAEFVPSLGDRKTDLTHFLSGIKRIIAGLFKKLVIADTLLSMINTAFGMDASKRGAVFAWLALLGFLIQLYYDFMGYTDIAIGLGCLFGFSLPENFDYPYMSSSVTEFWNRWHMTLGQWMKNYIYIPIFRACQSRKLTKIACYLLASLGVWLFSGAWHGVGAKTIVYGLYYYVLIAGERLLADHEKAKRKKLGIKKKEKTLRSMVSAHVYTAVAVVFGQLMFRCNSLAEYADYVKSMLGLGGAPAFQAEAAFYLRQDLVPLAAGILFSFPLLPAVRALAGRHGREGLLRALTPLIYGVMLITAVAFAYTGTYSSFVYFQF